MINILLEKDWDFNSLEKIFFKNACEIACETMKALLGDMDKILMGKREKCIYRHKGYHKTSIKTLMGDVEFSRAVYQVLDENSDKKHIYLLDEALGFDTIGKVSTNLAVKIAESVCNTSYSNTAKMISDITGQSISHQTAWNITQKLGSRIEKEEELLLDQYKKNKLKGKKEVEVLFEEQDGVYINLQGKDRKIKGKGCEMKVGIFYEGWEQKGKNRFQTVNKNAMCGFESTSKFMDKKEAKISSIYNTDEINFRFLNGDGAGWVKNRISNDVIFQLDPYHRNKAINRATSDKNIKNTIYQLLGNKDVDGCIEYLEALINSIEDEVENNKIKELYMYFNYTKEGLLSYKDRGLDIPNPPKNIEYRNMGTMENNINLVIANRLKGRRANWSISGATNIGKILCTKVSGILRKTIEKVTEITLPENYTYEIIKVLSSGKVPTKTGKGYEGKNGTISKEFGNVYKIGEIKPFSELIYR